MKRETMYFTSRTRWRQWLAKHHGVRNEVWLIFYKKSSGKPTITYDEAVEEAICYGWIDSQIKPVDGERYALRLTPRKEGSGWAESNKARALKMIRAGKMARAGRSVLPAEVLRPRGRRVGLARPRC
jgi:uncharacterized protein YdeI (YjbR/CyaY-like superfamily)